MPLYAGNPKGRGIHPGRFPAKVKSLLIRNEGFHLSSLAFFPAVISIIAALTVKALAIYQQQIVISGCLPAGITLVHCQEITSPYEHKAVGVRVMVASGADLDACFPLHSVGQLPLLMAASGGAFIGKSNCIPFPRGAGTNQSQIREINCKGKIFQGLRFYIWMVP